MNLKLHLILRIILIALICLLATAAYVLHRNNRQSQQEALLITESIARQLEFQLLRINAGFGQPNRFPDFDLWRQTSNAPGICVRYITVKGEQTHSVCTGSKSSQPNWPDAFAVLYRRLYQPDTEWSRTIRFNGKEYGTVYIASSAEMVIAHAWENLCQLVGLCCVTLLAVCILVYLTISRALRPAHAITTALEQMQQGDLSCRLPDFEIIEWQRTAIAINQLVASQQQLLNERQQLAMQLMTVQEEERRYLARELHDELGQCLTAVNALAMSIRQTAEQQCPVLVAEARQISHINQHIMANVRNLLLHLRPAEIDELGLAAGLNSLVAEANGRGGCRYTLTIQGNCPTLPEPLPVTVYRITQECLTNIAKHASASQAEISLAVTAEALTLTVADNGICKQLPLPNQVGMGLLGIRERVTALGGRVTLSIAKPNGLAVQCWLPIST